MRGEEVRRRSAALTSSWWDVMARFSFFKRSNESTLAFKCTHYSLGSSGMRIQSNRTRCFKEKMVERKKNANNEYMGMRASVQTANLSLVPQQQQREKNRTSAVCRKTHISIQSTDPEIVAVPLAHGKITQKATRQPQVASFSRTGQWQLRFYFVRCQNQKRYGLVHPWQ